MEINEKKLTRQSVLLISCALFLIMAVVFVLITVSINMRTDEPADSSFSDRLNESSVYHENPNNELQNMSASDDSAAEVSETFAESEYISGESSSEESIDASEDEQTELSHGWFINKYGYTYLYGDSGYVQFNYGTQSLERYAEALNTLASVLPETTSIYTITAPVSSTFASIPREVYIEDNFYNKSQAAFVSTIESKLDERITSIPIIAKIEEQYNDGQYIFYRTDKNWTSLGAYTAYTAFCESSGINPYALNNFPKIEVGDYLGRFYLATESKEMEENPDSIVCYTTIPSVKTSLTIYDYGTVYNDYSLCGNYVTVDNAYDIYLGMTAGRYEVSTTVDGGNLLVIGDSSAYPLIPFLASHYNKIDMIDPQYFDGSLVDFLSEHQYDEVITICYSTNATTGDYIPAFNTMTGVTVDDE